MRKFLTFVFILVSALMVIHVPNSFATQPPPGYPTATILWTADTNFGPIPLRRGFYDADMVNPDPDATGENAVGVGFGMDKAWNKHYITNSQVIKFTMGAKGFLRKPEGSVVNFQRRLETITCVPTEAGPICNPDQTQSYDILVAAEMEEFVEYWGWPAGDPVGVLTAFCEGYTGYCPYNVNSPAVADLVA